MSFNLVIVGRPNVGKSTLFNKLAGKKLAIVNDTPGVTRDWRSAEAHLGDLNFTVTDTAGLENADPTSMEGRMRRQTELALERADMALMMIDARAGLTTMDRHFANLIRKLDIPVFLAANKCDTNKGQENLYEAYELGLGEPIEFSAEHGIGFDVLYEAILDRIPEDELPPVDEDADADELAWQKELDALEEADEIDLDALEAEEQEIETVVDTSKPLLVAIVGRPNAGKSTLINTLLGEERMMTGPEPGITRDAVHVEWEHEGRKYRLVDTAGMRKKAKIQETLERLSVHEALRAIRLANVVILMTDAQSPMDKQDLQIADLVIREGRSLVIAVNKWDLVDDKAKRLAEVEDKLKRSLNQVKDVPVVTISAVTRQRLGKLLQAVVGIYDTWNIRISTAKLNRWLGYATQKKPAPLVEGRSNRLRYITQAKTRPPTFVVWAARPTELPESYKRYLMNSLREDFGIPGVPIRFYVRTSKNPFAE